MHLPSVNIMLIILIHLLEYLIVIVMPFLKINFDLKYMFNILLHVGLACSPFAVYSPFNPLQFLIKISICTSDYSGSKVWKQF